MSTASDAPPRPKRRISLLRSVGARLFLSVLGGSLVGLIVSSFLAYRELSRLSEAELRSNLQVKAENLRGDFNTLESSTKLVEMRSKPYTLLEKSVRRFTLIW
jgi:hypothetical protein